MVLYNNEKNDIFIRILYAGPAGAGKIENLHALEEYSIEDQDTENRTLFSNGDEFVFTEYVQPEETEIKGMGTGVYLYFLKDSVTDSTLLNLINEVDGVVFVLDADERKLTDNQKEMNRFKKLMKQSNMTYDDLPVVLQFNSTSENALSEEELDEVLNRDNIPFYLTDTTQGIRVEESLEGITDIIFKSLETRFEEDSDVNFQTFTDVEDILGQYSKKKEKEPEIPEEEEEVELDEELSLLDDVMSERESDTILEEDSAEPEGSEDELFQLEDPEEIDEETNDLLDDVDEEGITDEMFDIDDDSSGVSAKGDKDELNLPEEEFQNEEPETDFEKTVEEDIEIKVGEKSDIAAREDTIKIPLKVEVGGREITLNINISLSLD